VFSLGPGFGTQSQDNLVDANAGDLVTSSSTAHVKGSYTNLLTANFTAFGFTIAWHDSFVTATNSSMLMDVAYNDGTDHIIVPNFLVGYTGARSPSAHFPLTVPSGSVLKVRTQGAIASGTVRVGVWLWGGTPTVAGPWGLSSCTAYGVDTATSDGTAVAGGQAVKGSWTSIAAASSAAHPTIAVGMQFNGNVDTGVRLGWACDVGDGSTIWHSNLLHESDSNEYGQGPFPSIHGIREISVPSGTALQARAAAQSTTAPRRTRTVALYGSVA